MSTSHIHSLSTRQRFLLLGALYFSQGIPFGLFVQAVPVLLREGGTSLEGIGLSSLLALPWGLKFLWAPWVDRPLGKLPRRKGWLIPLQLLTMVSLGALMLFDPLDGNLVPLLAGVLWINLLNATQDIATDGLAVEVLRPEERGKGNGLQVGGYRVGMIFGGAGALVLIETLGWWSGLAACILALAVALLPVLAFPEGRSAAEKPDTAEAGGFTVLRSFFRGDGAWTVLALLVAYKLGDAMAAGMVRPMLVDLGFSMTEIGAIVGGVGFVAGLAGAVLGGVVADRTTRRRALAVGVGMQVLGALLYIPLVLIGKSNAAASWLVGIEGVVGGMATVILFTCMMDWCRPRHTGSDYTVMASIVVLATGLGSVLSGVSASNLGYAAHLALSAALTLIGGAFAVWKFPTRRYPSKI